MNNNQIQKNSQSKALSPVDQVRQELSREIVRFKAALPSHIEATKFLSVLMTYIQNNPNLLNCDRGSLFTSALACANDGLLPDGKEAALVAYSKECNYLPMVAGICKKARQSGEIMTMNANVVYENDDYKSWTDEKGEHFEHVKARGDRGKPIFTFAYALTKDGGVYFEEMTEAQVQDVRSMSKAKNGPWNGPFADEMRRKTALHRLCKYRLPSSTDLDRVLQRDYDLYDLNKPKEEKAGELSSKLAEMNAVEAEFKPAPEVPAAVVTPKAPDTDPNSFSNFTG